MMGYVYNSIYKYAVRKMLEDQIQSDEINFSHWISLYDRAYYFGGFGIEICFSPEMTRGSENMTKCS